MALNFASTILQKHGRQAGYQCLRRTTKLAYLWFACSALALDQFCCWFAFMQVGGWMYLWHDKEVTNDGRAASWWVDLSMAGKEVTNHGRARNECSVWSGRSCLNNEEMCRWFDFIALGGEAKFWRQASLHVCDYLFDPFWTQKHYVIHLLWCMVVEDS